MKGSRWPLFLARRYFWASRRGRNIASSILSVIQMCLGTALLIVVIGVMNGFQSGFIQSILEAGTYHVRVGFQGFSREEAEALLNEYPLVASVTGFLDVQVLASGAYGSSQAVNLRLVDEDAFKRDPVLADSLGLDASASFSGKGASLILGGELASSIGASTGEQVEILSVRMDDELGAIPERIPFTVSGTFKTKKKYYEYDRLWAFAPLWTAESLGEGETEPFLGVKLKDPNKDGEFKRDLARDKRTASFDVRSWRETNRAFFGALRMEKTVMMLVIGLVFLIIAVNIFHSMERSVRERQLDLGLLRAIGARPREIRSIFALEGLFVGGAGSLAGVIAGLAISMNVNAIFTAVERAVNGLIAVAESLTGRITGSGSGFAFFSPVYFYIEEVPVSVYFPEVLVAFLAGTAASVAAALLASRSVSELDPQEIFRYE
jgi:lipoprotein-releasing system permease protein